MINFEVFYYFGIFEVEYVNFLVDKVIVFFKIEGFFVLLVVDREELLIICFEVVI